MRRLRPKRKCCSCGRELDLHRDSYMMHNDQFYCRRDFCKGLFDFLEQEMP